MNLNKLLRLSVLLALAAIVVAAATGTAAHAQTVDQSLPPLADLSIDAEIQSVRTAWVVTVKANRIGRHPLARVRNVKVQFSVESVSPSPQYSALASPLSVGTTSDLYGSFDKSNQIWTIPELAAASATSSETVAVAIANVPNIPAVSRPVVSRLNVEIIGSDPAEPPGFDSNNAAAMLFASARGGRGHHPHGDAGVIINDISERSPNAGGTTTFTVLANNTSRFYSRPLQGLTYYSTQLGVQVRIELSPGLTFAGTPSAPSGTTYRAATNIWDVGTLETGANNAKSLPVAVNLTSHSLDDLPLEHRCLTAEVISAVPWFPSDLRKRDNDIATACLGEEGEEPTPRLEGGRILLFYFYPCVDNADDPCTSDDTLELYAIEDEGDNVFTRRRPDEFILRISDPLAREESTNGEPVWSTSNSFTLIESQKILPATDWRAAQLALTVTGPDGGPLPGPFTVDYRDSGIPDFEITDTTKVTGDPFDEVGYDVGFDLIFGTLGTYVLDLDISATHKSGTSTDTSDDVTYNDSGTFTFHVVGTQGADVEIRDAGASPAVAADRQAYTVMAVNNGPEEAGSVRVTGLPTGVTEFTASQGEYDPASGVWNVGRLRVGNYRSLGHADEGPTLTLITADTAGTAIIPEIENTDYCVRIKTGATDPENDLKCVGDLPTGYTEHSAPYYGDVERNNSTTITARAGTGEGAPGAPQSVEAMATSLGVFLTWQPVEQLNGLAVTHYQVQRSASPWETLATDVAATKKPLHLDKTAGSGSAAYRVRAVNIFGVPGPWSEPSSRRPGVPRDLRADMGSGQFTLSWNAPEAVTGVTVTGYELQYSEDGGSIWTDLPAQGSMIDTYDHTGLTLLPGAVWQYRARAVGEDGGETVMSEWATASVTVADPKPGVPKDFTASVVSDTKANLTWSAPDAVTHVTVTGYEFGFSRDGGNTWEALASQAATATAFTHTHSALSAGDTRQYRGRTVGEVSSGGQTVVVKGGWAFAVATKDHPAPGVPKDFTATGVSDAQANLEWSAPDAVTGVTVTGYDIDFSTDGGNTWDSLAAGRTVLTFPHTDNTLAADAVRQYRVRTVGTVSVGGETVEETSEWAFAAATRDYPTPGAPRNFTARAINESQVKLSWSEPEAVAGVNLTGYHLDFSTDGNTWKWLPVGQTRTVLSATTTSHDHIDDTLPAGAIRQYRLRAVGTDANNAVFESGWVFASVATEEVGPPQNLAAMAVGSGRINLTWGEPGFGADRVTGYRIDYALGSSDAWQTLEHGYRTIPRSYQHTGLTPGQKYCYRVAATYAGGTGPFAAGDDACETTDETPTYLPGKPENLRFASVGRNYVTLEWDPPSVGGKVEYYQWRSNIHDPQKVKPETATSVTVRGLSPSWSYGFQVRAGNESHGPGQWSREIQTTLNLAGDAIKVTPQELEVDKGGSGSFNVGLSRAPQWPLMLYLSFEGPACLTESLPYQQGKILLPTNPSYPSKEFWEDPWWGPPGGRLARPWNSGLDIVVNAAGCRGGETAVVDYDLSSLPFSYLEDLPMWEELGLNQEEWREKWGVDRLDGASGPSVKVTVEDGGISGQQSSPGVGAAQLTAVALALDAATVSENAGQVTLTATLDAPAPPGGVSLLLYPGIDAAAARDADYTMPDSIEIPAGERSGTGKITVADDDLDEEDETANVVAFAALDHADLAGSAVLTIVDDDTAGVRVSAASGLAVDEDGTASYTVVLDSQPTSDVTVTPSSDDPGAATVSPASHTFTPSGWDTPLTFTVSGLADDDTDDESVLIRLGVTSADPKYAAVQVDSVLVAVTDTTPEQQQEPPTVASAIADATIVHESGTHAVSLAGVFDDADGDSLTVTAASDAEAMATVSVAADHSSLTVTAKSRGTATITVSADDGRGGTVEDTFAVTVKAAPVVASAISDISGMGVLSAQEISLTGVFSDADGDSLTLSAASSDNMVVEPLLVEDTLTVYALEDGSATITVTAEDSDGNTVSDTFDVSVVGPPTPVSNLSCVASTDQVLFQWDVPEWSGAELYAYDYDLTLPDGRSQQVRLRGYPTVRERGEYQVGKEASISVKAVYELADESVVYSEAATLTCTVAE